MKISVNLILILAIFSGCMRSHKASEYKKVEEIVKYWHNRKIIIPNSLETLGKEIDIAPYSLNDTIENKVIVLIQGDCQMCLQEIQDWIPFYDKMKERQISNRLYFIIEHTNLIYFKKIYAGDLPTEFNFIIDESGKLSEINHLPKDKKYKTFLLNKYNKVLFIGSPILNENMRDLFLEELKMKQN